MPFYVTAWNWLAKNPVAQGVASAIAVVAGFLFWLAAFHDPRIRKEAVRKANDRAEKQSKTILKNMEEDINETVEAADRAAERVPSGLDSTSLPKRLRRFVKYTGGSDSGGEREG